MEGQPHQELSIRYLQYLFFGLDVKMHRKYLIQS
jgi:hypothetical protein